VSCYIKKLISCFKDLQHVVSRLPYIHSACNYNTTHLPYHLLIRYLKWHAWRILSQTNFIQDNCCNILWQVFVFLQLTALLEGTHNAFWRWERAALERNHERLDKIEKHHLDVIRRKLLIDPRTHVLTHILTHTLTE